MTHAPSSISPSLPLSLPVLVSLPSVDNMPPPLLPLLISHPLSVLGSSGRRHGRLAPSPGASLDQTTVALRSELQTFHDSLQVCFQDILHT